MVVRVHGRHVGFDAVDHHQGRTARTDRVLRAADAHRRAAVGLTVGKGHRKAGDGALQRARNAHRRTHALFEALCRKGFDGAYDVAALLYAVTDDDNLFEAGVVFAHGDVDGGLVVDVDCLGFVAHIAEIQAFGIVSIDRVRTVGIGSRAFRGTGDGDGDTYEGISRVVFNDTRDGLPPPCAEAGSANVTYKRVTVRSLMYERILPSTSSPVSV